MEQPTKSTTPKRDEEAAERQFNIFELALRGAIRELEVNVDDRYAVGLLEAWHDFSAKVKPFIS